MVFPATETGNLRTAPASTDGTTTAAKSAVGGTARMLIKPGPMTCGPLATIFPLGVLAGFLSWSWPLAKSLKSEDQIVATILSITTWRFSLTRETRVKMNIIALMPPAVNTPGMMKPAKNTFLPVMSTMRL